MKDFLGNELNVGDKVIFCKYPHAFLFTGKVLGFTPKKIRIESDSLIRNQGLLESVQIYKI